GLDALFRRFPGPLLVDRRAARGSVLPPVAAHGPILRAILRFGSLAQAPLMRLLAHSNADVRFYATYLLVDLATAQALPLVAQRLFDGDGQVRMMAIEVVRHLGNHDSMEHR